MEKEKEIPEVLYAPKDKYCFWCGAKVCTDDGNLALVTYCPHCNRSFVE